MNKLKLKDFLKTKTVQIWFNLQNPPTFHSEERLANLERVRECFVGLLVSGLGIRSSVLWGNRSFFGSERAIRSQSLFCEEQWERIAPVALLKGATERRAKQITYFESDSLTVTLLLRGTRAICSQSLIFLRAMRAIPSQLLFFKEGPEGMAHSQSLNERFWAKDRRAKERIPNHD